MKAANKPDENFIMIPYSLFQSASWRLMSINCKKLIDFLSVEHLSKGGQENGNLKATYNQLVSIWHISSSNSSNYIGSGVFWFDTSGARWAKRICQRDKYICPNLRKDSCRRFKGHKTSNTRKSRLEKYK